MEKKIKAARLQNFIEEAISAAGLPREKADIFARSLVIADLRGIKSHGVVRLPTYIQRVEKGILDPKATGIFLREEGATALLDAQNGLGQISGHRAMRHAISKAREYGFGLVGVKNSNHFGIASFYSMMALKENMIGVVLTNSSPAVNPYGTISPLLGTNPLSFAIPADKEKDIVLDMSTSMVARGKIRIAAAKDNKIPLGWATDSQGNPRRMQARP